MRHDSSANTLKKLLCNVVVDIETSYLVIL